MTGEKLDSNFQPDPIKVFKMLQFQAKWSNVGSLWNITDSSL